MDEKELDKLCRCLESKMKSEPIIFTGCAEGSILITRVLEKLKIPHKRVFGRVKTADNKEVSHCWVEVGDTVIEPNPSQVLGINKRILPIKKEAWEQITEGVEKPDIIDVGLTPAGQTFYSKEAEMVVRCYKTSGLEKPAVLAQ